MEVSLSDGFLSSLVSLLFLACLLSLAAPYVLQRFHYIIQQQWNAQPGKMGCVCSPLRDNVEGNRDTLMPHQCHCMHCKTSGSALDGRIPIACNHVSRDQQRTKCHTNNSDCRSNIEGCCPKTPDGGSMNVNSSVLTASLQNGTSTVAITINDLFNSCTNEVEVGLERSCNCKTCNTSYKSTSSDI